MKNGNQKAQEQKMTITFVPRVPIHVEALIFRGFLFVLLLHFALMMHTLCVLVQGISCKHTVASCIQCRSYSKRAVLYVLLLLLAKRSTLYCVLYSNAQCTESSSYLSHNLNSEHFHTFTLIPFSILCSCTQRMTHPIMTYDPMPQSILTQNVVLLYDVYSSTPL